MPEVYLLHFDKPYWKSCRHYVGYTKYTAEHRCEQHRSKGQGSKLIRYALTNGCDFKIVHVEQYDTTGEARKRELQIKRGGHFDRLCPICKGEWNGIYKG